MHRSPQRPIAARRDKYADFDADDADAQAERRAQRGNQPKARKFPLREESGRETRWDKQFPDR